MATEPINIKLLNDDLIKELPDYMIPSYYVQLEKMPLNHNGKIDRKALPKPNTNIEEKYVEPENEVEEKLQEIISKVLNKEKISVESDLMTAGLTSLGVITVITQLSMQGIEIRVQDFYKCKTIILFKLLCDVASFTGLINTDVFISPKLYIPLKK